MLKELGLTEEQVIEQYLKPACALFIAYDNQKSCEVWEKWQREGNRYGAPAPDWLK